MMTVHVLHAGDGYTYLTNQVASGDVQRERGQSLSDYYMQNGNPPGQWVGTGLAALEVSGEVTEAQMKALFGEGLHPDADELIATSIAQGANPDQAIKDARLGRRFPVFKEGEADVFPRRLAGAYKAFAAEHDRVPETGRERDALRWQTALEILSDNPESRVPARADIAHYLATRGADQRKPVAGYDLVFTPVKSVSTLWGLSDDATRETITTVHREAWSEALAWVQSEAALTRVGAGGAAQIETNGLIATAFDHLDSRTGDPNLHTHVAVSTKVQGIDGKWRSLDGRVLHALGVAASERYNTAIETKMRDRLGVRFVPEGRPGKRPVREVAGVSAEVRGAFSQRRGQVEAEYTKLLAEYRREHGREAPRAVQFKLAQQATLATRQAKTESAGLRERLPQWRATAAAVLGGERRVERMIRHALAGAPEVDQEQSAQRPPAPVETMPDLAETVLARLGEKRSTWNAFHVSAEASRVVRGSQWAQQAPPGTDVATFIEEVSQRALATSLALTPEELNPAEGAMTRSDGSSIYTQHGARRYTSAAVLGSEERLLNAASSDGGLTVDADVIAGAIAAVESEKGRTLNEGQRALAAAFAGDGKRVVAGIGPAGAGKTTAMSAFARAVDLAGGRVLALAPSAVAGAVLGDELGVTADTLDKVLDVYRRRDQTPVPEKFRLDAGTVVLVDEAGMAGTAQLDGLLRLAEEHGASVRLLGDPQQLNSVGAGGVLRLIEKHVGAVGLTEVHRFRNDDGGLNEDEARASLLLREGDTRGLDYYVEGDRVRGGTREAMLEEIYSAWSADVAAGQSAVMIAATNSTVVDLNTRARADRIGAGTVRGRAVDLHDGSSASRGDIIVTRHNDRRLRTGHTDWVRNGDLWRITRVHADGGLSAVHQTTKVTATLPASYVRDWVELGYAATINRVQGMTTDTQHGLIDDTVTRNQLYTANTRGQYLNRMYVVTDEALDIDLHSQPDPASAIRQTLESVLARTGEEPSALEALETEWDTAHSLAQLVPAYEDAYTRLLEPDRLERYETVVSRLLPDHAEAILSDAAWPVLARRMAAHEAGGVDVAALLPQRVDVGKLATADSVARVLHFRLGEPVRVADSPRLPAWMLPPPEERTGAFADQRRATAPASGAARTAPRRASDVAVASVDVSHVPELHGPATPAAEVDAHGRTLATEINAAAWQWWSQQDERPESWTAGHLAERGLAGHLEHGWAPPTWTGLVDHLREHGYRDEDLTAAGVATHTRDGRLIDRFRDRLVVPIRNDAGDVVGVTARANPDVTDERAPKYINTPASAAYDKSQLLLGWSPEAARKVGQGATVVFVEGPMDRAAIDSLGRDDVVALAPCGTALTDAQLDLVRDAGGDLSRRAIFAFDGDSAGQAAAQRAWVRLDPTEAAGARYLNLPPGSDPADLVQRGQAQLLGMALQGSGSLTEALVDQVIATADMDRVESRVATARNIADSVARLPQSLDLDLYVTHQLAAHMDPELVGQLLQQARNPEREETAEPLPAPAQDPHVRAWLQRQAALIEDRIDALVSEVEGPTPPPWALELASAPAAVGERAAWRADIREIAAYRDRYGITGTNPLGTQDAPRGTQRAALRTAQESLQRLARAPGQEVSTQERDRLAQARQQVGRERVLDRAGQAAPPLTPQERLERARQMLQQPRTPASAPTVREETDEQRRARLAREAADRARRQSGPQL